MTEGIEANMAYKEKERAEKTKKLGEGVVVEIWKGKVVIQFEEEQRLFELKTLYEYDLLVF